MLIFRIEKIFKMGDSDDSKKEKKLGFIKKSNDDLSDSG
jgi:hypothetical protein